MRLAVRASAFLIAASLALPAALLGEAPALSPVTVTPGTLTPGNPPAPSDSAHSASGTAAPDSLARPKSRADTVLVVRHGFHHREQIITGSVVMTCLALMMVVMNNYNPR